MKKIIKMKALSLSMICVFTSYASDNKKLPRVVAAAPKAAKKQIKKTHPLLKPRMNKVVVQARRELAPFDKTCIECVNLEQNKLFIKHHGLMRASLCLESFKKIPSEDFQKAVVLFQKERDLFGVNATIIRNACTLYSYHPEQFCKLHRPLKNKKSEKKGS